MEFKIKSLEVLQPELGNQKLQLPSSHTAAAMAPVISCPAKLARARVCVKCTAVNQRGARHSAGVRPAWPLSNNHKPGADQPNGFGAVSPRRGFAATCEHALAATRTRAAKARMDTVPVETCDACSRSESCCRLFWRGCGGGHVVLRSMQAFNHFLYAAQPRYAGCVQLLVHVRANAAGGAARAL
jgi:hypothetical protein